jgi:hypothetical protein
MIIIISGSNERFTVPTFLALEDFITKLFNRLTNMDVTKADTGILYTTPHRSVVRWCLVLLIMNKI